MVIIILCLGLVAIQKAPAQDTYVFDAKGEEEVRKDFNVDIEKSTAICRFLAPGWVTGRGAVGRHRIYWLKVTEACKGLEGVDELHKAIRYGEYSEVYQIVKNLPKETMRKLVTENNNLVERDVTWLRDDWRVI